MSNFCKLVKCPISIRGSLRYHSGTYACYVNSYFRDLDEYMEETQCLFLTSDGKLKSGNGRDLIVILSALMKCKK